MHPSPILRRAALITFCGAILGIASAAQDEIDPAQKAQLDRVLNERKREALHPGHPLSLSGLDQGDEGFRVRTPMLLHSDGAVANVDQDELYQRRLALYGGGTSFTSPLAPTELNATRTVRERVAPTPRAETADPKERGLVRDIVIVSLFSVLSALLALRQVIRWSAPHGTALR